MGLAAGRHAEQLGAPLSKEPSGREEAEMLYRRVLEVDPDDVNAPHDL